MNILDELWYGNISPQEQSKDNNRAIKELLNLMGARSPECRESKAVLTQA